ncbi:hypothetical protein AK830_g7010 [Neonectria ditissima]|uniref:Heterokaryon incompatibility domain-containing protein n=1 Tax=Neonectria ditissima TaxID=78410 RepID=A0A0P7AP25_9HYPO|nr:hypothetical protein AK830_g7010 [Neonectria ditissima]
MDAADSSASSADIFDSTTIWVAASETIWCLEAQQFVALQSDVTISLWLDYTEESSPKWPLMLRADPVGERWTRWNLRLQGTDGRREIIAFGARVASQLPTTGTSDDTPRLFQATIDWESVSQFPFGIRPSGEEALQILPGISEFWDESKAASKGAVPDSLRVIDVLQDCVVTLPPSASYVTLSYMWGQRQDRLQATMDNVTMLSQPGSLSTAVLPRTISDALQACKNLGQRYIWVDRLCVCQDDPNIKVLLDLMGAIYHNASFTIVAVDGDAESGLPGVGETKRL